MYNSPTGCAEAQKQLVAVILKINAELIKLFAGQQLVSMDFQTATCTDPALASQCISRLQQNLSYLAGIADRATKPQAAERPLPQLLIFDPPTGLLSDSPLHSLYDLMAQYIAENPELQGTAYPGAGSAGQSSAGSVASNATRSPLSATGGATGGPHTSDQGVQGGVPAGDRSQAGHFANHAAASISKMAKPSTHPYHEYSQSSHK